MSFNTRLLIAVFVLTLSACSVGAVKVDLRYGSEPQLSEDCVVLLHGLARRSASMKKLETAFSDTGYRTLNIDYPSTRFDNVELLKSYIKPVVDRYCSQDYYRLSFVGHSMGGILSRLYIEQYKPPSIGKVVTIASPHKGSELVDKLGWIPLFKWINGSAGYEMGTNADGLIEGLPIPDYPVLAIVGTASTNPFYSMLIPGKDDGKVSVVSASLDGADKIMSFPYAHTFIMQKAPVIEASVSFLLE